jgi:hypothetical protein
MPEKETEPSSGGWRDLDIPLLRWWELVSGEKCENPYVNIWALVGHCKSHSTYVRLWKHAYARRTKLLKSVTDDNGLLQACLNEYTTALYAIGFVVGMQQGYRLNGNTMGETRGTGGLILKHAAVRRLLLRQPKATTLEVCKALDKAVGMPWPKLRKKYGTWEAAVKEPLVKVAITDARKAAIQEAIFSEFLAVAKGVGDGGSILNKFRVKEFGLRKSK